MTDGFAQPPLPLMENEKVIERVRAAEQQTLVKRYTEKSILFIRNNKEEEFLPVPAAHGGPFPVVSGQGVSRKVGQRQLRRLGGGNRLERGADPRYLARPETRREDARALHFRQRRYARAVNAPLRGYKNSTWEGGMREPTIAWWPGKIPAGTATGEIAGMMDVWPTLVRLAGGRRPAGRKDRRRRHLATNLARPVRSPRTTFAITTGA